MSNKHVIALVETVTPAAKKGRISIFCLHIYPHVFTDQMVGCSLKVRGLLFKEAAQRIPFAGEILEYSEATNLITNL